MKQSHKKLYPTFHKKLGKKLYQRFDSFFVFIKELTFDEGGQGTVEYILILSASVVGASQLTRIIISSLDKGILRFGAQLEKDLKTGRAPLSVWDN